MLREAIALQPSLYEGFYRRYKLHDSDLLTHVVFHRLGAQHQCPRGRGCDWCPLGWGVAPWSWTATFHLQSQTPSGTARVKNGRKAIYDKVIQITKDTFFNSLDIELDKQKTNRQAFKYLTCTDDDSFKSLLFLVLLYS